MFDVNGPDFNFVDHRSLLLPIGLIGVSMSFPANGDVYMRGGIVSIEFPLFYCSLYDLVCGQAE